MLNWIIENKEWFFSGAGVAIISGLIFLLKSNKNKNKQRVVSKKARDIEQTNTSSEDNDQIVLSETARDIKQNNN